MGSQGLWMGLRCRYLFEVHYAGRGCSVGGFQVVMLLSYLTMVHMAMHKTMNSY